VSEVAATVRFPTEGGRRGRHRRTKDAKNEALEALLNAVTLVSGQGASAGHAAAARDFALAYRYIAGGTQPGSSVVSSK
jgi:hypothetical protein